MCDLVPKSCLGLRVTSTSLCHLKAGGDAKGWGQGHPRPAPGREEGLPRAVARMWGILLAAEESLPQSFYFLRL